MSAVMSSATSSSISLRPVILAILLFANVASGFSRDEVHAHQDATPGHTHHVADHNHDINNDHPDIQVHVTADTDRNDRIHMHDTSAHGFAVIPAAVLSVGEYPKVRNNPVLLTQRPPDKATPPLYRPPIV
ncbi:MAG: hypothetical protein RLN69_11655 [Woeseiaceae bacterium]